MKFCAQFVCKPESRTPKRARGWLLGFGAAALLFGSTGKSCPAQGYSAYQREQAETMLRDVTQDVEKHYFDPLALGNDWEVRIRAARVKIDHAGSMNQALAEIAAVLDSLNDSHTFFLPPPRPYRNDYGFEMQMIGDRCFVTHVRSGSDADAKGIRPGDQLISIDGYAPARSDIWRMKFVFWVLRPQPELQLILLSTAGEQRQVNVIANYRMVSPAIADRSRSSNFDDVRQMELEQEALRPRFAERGHDLLIVKLVTFALAPAEIDSVVNKMRKHNAVILDLRGNPGGDQEAVRKLLGSLFDRKVTIGSSVGRRSEPIETEPYPHCFTGKVVVLLDSESGSGSEVFARVMQLEKRGLVIGDQSSGRAMAAQRYLHRTGLDTVILYGTSVTEFEIRMADGQVLEHQGVIPDRLILPTASDLAGGRDPALAAAANALNVKMTPEEAGALFPYRWPGD